MSVLAAAAVPHPPIILPEVGRGEEKKIAKSTAAYIEAMRRTAGKNPETVIIISPHTVMYHDYFHISPGKSAKGGMDMFGVRGFSIASEYDTEFVETLSEIAKNEGIPAGVLGERDKALDHGTTIPLYFLNKFLADYKIVRVGLSGRGPLEHYRLGRCIARAAEILNRRAVVIASGDLSHKLKESGPYGFAPEGPEFDRQLTEALGAGDFLSILGVSPELAENAAECGLRSFQIMAGALDRRAVTQELLSYEGPFGVGYGVAFFDVTGEDGTRDFGVRFEREEKSRQAARKAGEDEYVRLARHSLETYIKTGRQAPLPDFVSPEMLERRAGTFVSLKKHGRLRGCIGTISAVEDNIAREIMVNAVSAAACDPRFSPVTPEELSEITYSVDVLGEIEKIDSPDKLDVKRYGVIVQKGGRRGLLLPNLDGIETVGEQIAIAKEKAGIGKNEIAALSRFEVVRHI